MCSRFIDMWCCADFRCSHNWSGDCWYRRSSIILMRPTLLIVREFFLACSRLSLTLSLFERDPCSLPVSLRSLPLLQSRDLSLEVPLRNMFRGVGGMHIRIFVCSHQFLHQLAGRRRRHTYHVTSTTCSSSAPCISPFTSEIGGSWFFGRLLSHTVCHASIYPSDDSSVVCLLLALQWGGTVYPWNNSRIIGLFVGFGLMVIIFIIIQIKKGDKATLPISVLKQRTVASSVLFSLFMGASFFTLIYYSTTKS